MIRSCSELLTEQFTASVSSDQESIARQPKLINSTDFCSRTYLPMKKTRLGRIVEVLVACAFFCVTGAVAQDESGDWSLTGADAGHSGWQKGERNLSPNDIATD